MSSHSRNCRLAQHGARILVQNVARAACAALMHGAARHLADGGRLVLYGPYPVDGEPAARSNLALDADLRARDPQKGLCWWTIREPPERGGREIGTYPDR